MTSWKLRLAAPALALTLLSGCGLVNFNVTACPPIARYSKSFTGQVAAEVEKLPEGSAIEEMLKDYSVLREQLRMCR